MFLQVGNLQKHANLQSSVSAETLQKLYVSAVCQPAETLLLPQAVNMSTCRKISVSAGCEYVIKNFFVIRKASIFLHMVDLKIFINLITGIPILCGACSMG